MSTRPTTMRWSKPYWRAAHERSCDLRHGPDGHAARRPTRRSCSTARSAARRGGCCFLPLVAAVDARLCRAADRPRRLKEINHRLLLGGEDPSARPEAAGRQLRRQAGRDEHPARRAARRSRATRREGRRLVLATASYRLYADAIAERLGFDDVIGTGSVIGLDERVHAKIAGENCYGPAKLRMIADWVEASGLKGAHGHVRFYSDHVSDQPAFEWADEPVAVNPHGKLAPPGGASAAGRSRSWRDRTCGPRPRSARWRNRRSGRRGPRRRSRCAPDCR